MAAQEYTKSRPAPGWLVTEARCSSAVQPTAHLAPHSLPVEGVAAGALPHVAQLGGGALHLLGCRADIGVRWHRVGLHWPTRTHTGSRMAGKQQQAVATQRPLTLQAARLIPF